ncbi:hypothetical protein [Streptomyces sp. NBC_00344]|uniref:hypothetical protein n=1 Tax=Streptomyces sp. NBC_00344 TaxID=2975720 RepID=UPI002E1C14E6
MTDRDTDREQRLPEELRMLGRRLDSLHTDGDSMAERVLAQLIAESVPTPVRTADTPGRVGRARAWARRRWRALLALFSGLLILLVLTPPVRAAVVDWFDFGGVAVHYDPTAPARAGASVPGCGTPVTSAAAGRTAGFAPVVPTALGTPAVVSVAGGQSNDTERAPAGPAPHVRASVVWGLSGVGGWPQTRAAPGGDIAIEREDQVMVGDDSTVWVRSDPAVDVKDDDIRWHRVPAEVLDLLAKHRLLGPAEAAATGRPTTAGWWWALPGLAVGAAAGYGGALLGRRRGHELPEPRRQLIDLDS